MPITNTWRARLSGTNSWLRRGGLIVGLTSCSIVAIATIAAGSSTPPSTCPARPAPRSTAPPWSAPTPRTA